MDWGLMDTRVTPLRRSAASFSAVMVSGRPASTVYSTVWLMSNLSFNRPSSRSICSAVRVVGVPPPM